MTRETWRTPGERFPGHPARPRMPPMVYVQGMPQTIEARTKGGDAAVAAIDLATLFRALAPGSRGQPAAARSVVAAPMAAGRKRGRGVL